MIAVKKSHFIGERKNFIHFWYVTQLSRDRHLKKNNPNLPIFLGKSSDTKAISTYSITRGRILSYFSHLCWNSIAVGKTVFFLYPQKFKPNIKLEPHVKIDMSHRFNYVLNKAHYLITWNHILLPIVVFVLCEFYCARVQLVTVYVVIRTVMWQGEQWKIYSEFQSIETNSSDFHFCECGFLSWNRFFVFETVELNSSPEFRRS